MRFADHGRGDLLTRLRVFVVGFRAVQVKVEDKLKALIPEGVTIPPGLSSLPPKVQ